MVKGALEWGGLLPHSKGFVADKKYAALDVLPAFPGKRL
jgi:hypothetical protein